jgi:hypothetical protein
MAGLNWEKARANETAQEVTMDPDEVIAIAEAKLRLKTLRPDSDCARDPDGVIAWSQVKSAGLRHGTASGLMRLSMGMEPAQAPSAKQFASPRGATFPAEFRFR